MNPLQLHLVHSLLPPSYLPPLFTTLLTPLVYSPNLQPEITPLIYCRIGHGKELASCSSLVAENNPKSNLCPIIR